MLDDNPVLRERLMAFGAFAGIGVFAVAAVDVMISGGFDFAPGRAPQARAEPSAYVRVVDAAHYVRDRVSQISWDEPMFVDTAAATEDLAGANDGSRPPERYAETSSDDLYQQIASLYAGEPADTYEDTQSYEYQTYEGEPAQPASEEKLTSAYEDASPW